MAVDIVELCTADVEVASATLTALYAPDRPFRHSGGAGQYKFRLRAVQVDELHSGRLASAKPSAFAAAYRQQYGDPPVRTLRA